MKFVQKLGNYDSFVEFTGKFEILNNENIETGETMDRENFKWRFERKIFYQSSNFWQYSFQNETIWFLTMYTLKFEKFYGRGSKLRGSVDKTSNFLTMFDSICEKWHKNLGNSDLLVEFAFCFEKFVDL